MGKRAGLLSGLEILPNEHSVPPTGMKNVEMRTRRRNYVIDFSNFEVNISINVKFPHSRRDENNHMNAREIYPALTGQLGYRDHVNGPLIYMPCLPIFQTGFTDANSK